MTLKYDQHGRPYEDLTDENKKLNNRIKELEKENEGLKAELAREKEDHQYDNLVHENELKSLKSKKHRMNQK